MSVSSVVGIDVAKAHVDVFVLGAEFKPQLDKTLDPAQVAPPVTPFK